jgi:hypothetical protein
MSATAITEYERRYEDEGAKSCGRFIWKVLETKARYKEIEACGTTKTAMRADRAETTLWKYVNFKQFLIYGTICSVAIFIIMSI